MTDNKRLIILGDGRFPEIAHEYLTHAPDYEVVRFSVESEYPTRNVLLWSGNHIGHHSVLRDNVFVSSHVVISGTCDIGENSFLGVNSTLANDITIGAYNWLGPDVVITRNTEPDTVWRPARSEKRD